MTTETLHSVRTKRNLAMDALALLADVDTSTISRIERGKQKASPLTVVRLAAALGVSARRMHRICEASYEAGQDGSAA